MSTLRTGAMVLAYKQEDYLAYCLRSLAPHVDDVLVLFSECPFSAYNPAAREQFRTPDGTWAILESLRPELPNLTVVEGIWDSEADARNTALQHLRAAGDKIVLIVDADEIYPDGGLRRLRAEIENDCAPGTVYRALPRTCYKRFDHVLVSDQRLAVAVHATEETSFTGRLRKPHGPLRDLPEDIWFWHLGYVLSDQRMWEKINTFGHAQEILPGWYEEKWLNWTPQTRDLSRKPPASRWPGTVRIDPACLPKILHSHPYFPRAEGEPA
jgi:hypothetical protein